MIGSFLLQAVLAAGPATSPDLSWMAGYWLSCLPDRQVSDTWTGPRAGVLAGATVTTRPGGALQVEFARIAPGADGVLAFHAIPDGQAPAAFALREAGERRLVFENLAHDFPQRVIYTRNGDTLTGRIEGRIGGAERSTDWIYKAAPLNAVCPALGG
jgi:hypothetical protein